MVNPVVWSKFEHSTSSRAEIPDRERISAAVVNVCTVNVERAWLYLRAYEPKESKQIALNVIDDSSFFFLCLSLSHIVLWNVLLCISSVTYAI